MIEDERETAAEELFPAPVTEAEAGELLEEVEEEQYRLTLPNFQGPLDLLLHLIRKHEIDIYDIPIVRITQQYNQYLETMEELDLEVAAEYIYMAALLIHIKSKMLLPQPEEGEPAEDPRQELVDRLIEYQRFRAVAESLAEVDVVRIGVWRRPSAPVPGAEGEELDLSEVSLFDLIDAFQGALRRYKLAHPQAMQLVRMVHRVSDKMREMVGVLQDKREAIRLLWYLEGRDRGELVAIFLGMLELVRLGAVSLSQDQTFSDILIQRTDHPIDPQQFELFDH